ncbi:glycosyltransferase [Pseudaminobacter sp. 19-2017]|uniref:Glycosyltransferase n=1 Tax=Pseudaminobacter soli (ex Zhang et al. 2022) TaxID=2831468 RepID=A0A942DZL9_9HYPH|nr:cellulose synthase catalytic subunit [Pseudaminobacter soli]MBS3648040.1 glycosyltransferase [Pseudaminobacter soli]
MFPPLLLGELGSSTVQIILVLSVGMIVPHLLDPRNNLHRAVLFGIAAVLAVRYLWWRATQTIAPFGLTMDCLASWSFFALETGAAISSLNSFLIMSRTRDRSEEATQNAGWWGERPAPRTAVLIATYNEEKEVLERTIVGAKSLDHPNVEVFVLDDGRRDWLRDFCEQRGVRYVRRVGNEGAKAGNMNNALRVLKEEGPPDFVAVLDADFVPHSNFLARAIALFHDPSVGLVQTPQHFFNADPIQHNLGLSRSYPDEQRFFFDHLQPARDGWGIAFCCGTSSVVRWSAIDEIGGFPTDSITEDFLLTLCLQEKGHRTVYLNEALTEGLAPEGLKEYITQRARWCLGLMQIARGRLGPLARNGLRLRDRWSVVDSVLFWATTFSFRIAALVFPLLYWYLNVTVVDASVPDVLSYFATYFCWVLISMNFVSGGMVVPIVNDVSQLLGAAPITRAAYTGLLQPKGHPFSVTAKGGDRSKVVVQWRLLAPFATLFLLTLIGVLLGIVSDTFVHNDAGDGKLVILFWTFYNLLVLAVTIIVCIELPRRERHLDDRPERVSILVNDRPVRAWIIGLTQNTVRIRGARLPDDQPVFIDIPGVGSVRAIVSTPTEDSARLLLEPTMDQHEALLKRFYAAGAAPGVVHTRWGAMLADLSRRLS